jgi:beta-lactamase regulating signal transducer with metallopeptidase domain
MVTSNTELTQFAYRLGWTLVHSLWQGAVVAMMLGIALAVLRRPSPQARYLASLAAMATILAAAGVTFRLTAPAIDTRLPSNTGPITVAVPITSHAQSPRSVTPGTVIQFGREPIPASSPRPLLERARGRLEPVLPWLTIAWAAGVLTLGLWHGGGWVAAQRLRVVGVSPPGEELLRIVRQLSVRLSLRRPASVALSALAQTPMAIGWLRPMVLLPAAILTGLTPAQLEGILAHELAHIRRRDYLVNLFQVLAETLLFYHPAVWWISRRVRLEREQCCDEIAVRACGDRCLYAESLAAVEEIRFSMTRAFALSAAGAGRGQMLARVKHILGLDEGPARPATARAFAGGVLVVLLLTAVTVGLLRAATAPATATAPQPTTRGVATAPAGSPRPTVLLVTRGNYFLERTFDRDGGVVTIAPEEFDTYTRAHWLAGTIIVFDRWAPNAPPPVPAMYVDAVPPGSGLNAEHDAAGHSLEIKNVDDVGWSASDPILKGMPLDHALFVAEAMKLHVPGDWRTLASSKRGNLIVAHDASGERQVVLAFDVLQSNWPFQSSFPRFMHRAMGWLRNEELPKETAGSSPTATPSKATPRLQFRVEAKPDESGDTVELKDHSGQSYRFRKENVLSESDVKGAHEQRAQNGRLAVDLEFTDAGAAKLLAVTSANLNRRLAIVFDGRVLSMPVIRSAISHSAMIDGGSDGMTPEQAKAICDAVESARRPAAGSPATSPATAPATQHASGLTADCVLSGVIDGKRRVLASPSFNVSPGSTIWFAYTGKPPVIIGKPADKDDIGVEVRVEAQPGDRARIFCLLQPRGAAGDANGYLENEAVRTAHAQNLLATQSRLNEAKEMLAEAQRDLDRRRIGLSGFQPYTLEEICRVDPTMLAKVNARNEQQTTYDYLVTKYGTNYPQTKEALQLLQLRQRDIEQSAKRFNEEFFIQPRSDGGPGRPISKDLSKLRAIVANDQKQLDAETAMLNKLTHTGGSETDQIVKLGEPVAVELADGTRLEVSVAAQKP